MDVHRRLAAGLRELGVEVVFGLMGDGNLRHLIDFADLGGHVVGAVTEGTAVSMADGYARVGRRVGVASVTHGPGATNTLTALTEAVRARTPLVVLTGDTPPSPEHLQRFDLRGLALLAGADYHRVLRADRVAIDLDAAVRQAATASRPVLFDVPVELHRAHAPDEPRLRPSPGVRAGTPCEDELDRALGIVASARRPVVLAGRGAVDARDEVLALAGILGAPVGNTLLAKGLFDGEPLDLGVVGTLGSATTLQTVQSADCLLVLGAGLNRYTTMNGFLLADVAVVQVDHDPTRIGGPAEVAVGLFADAGAAASAMTRHLREAVHEPTTGHPADLAERLHVEAGSAGRTVDGPDTLDPRTVMRWLDGAAPADRVVVTDTGRFAYAPWRLLGVSFPTDFTHTCNFASIGLGLGTAIGAAVASKRPTVVVAGDGGGIMNLLELATAVRLGLPLLVLICNDGAYGMEYGHLEAAGLDPTPARCVWPDFADLARATGADAVTVRNVEDLDRLRARVANLSAPLLIDVRCDPAVDVSADD